MIVVDLGCCPQEGERSIEPLVNHYRPQALYGFDPDDKARTVDIGGTLVVVANEAAWTYDGEIKLGNGAHNGLYDTIVPDYAPHGVWNRIRTVRCFDFAAWLLDHPVPTVVKMNVEGAEFELLRHVLDRGADEHVREWIVQWHDDRMPAEYADRRSELEQRVRCPIRTWGLADIWLDQ